MTQFDSPRLKICRAGSHITELNRLLDEFVSQKPVVIVAKLGGFSFEVQKPFPKDIPLTIGDAAHNLRTALDLLAGDLVHLNGKSTKGVYFPFANDEIGLDEQIKDKHFDRAAADVIDLLKTLKPFKGGDDLLRALHDLDILDKHQLIVPAIGGGTAKHVTLTFPDGRKQGIANISGAMNQMDFGGYPPGTVIEAGSIEPLVIFGHGSPIPLVGTPVFESLQKLAKTTLGVVETFEAHCFG
jgi:hypothetical protein